MRFLSICLILCLLFAVQPAKAQSSTFYVATNGSDSTGNGSLGNPWGTITYALQRVPDGSLILVRPGTYTGQVKLKGSFTKVTIRSEVPYRAKLRFNDQVLVSSGPATGIVFEGFDVAHSGPGAGPLVAHIMGSRKLGLVRNITIRNNIFHDSYNSDLMKIDSSASNIIVEFNMFYNQSGSDEHIDVNSARDIIIRYNTFFNDFAGSGRPNNNNTSNFIVVKDSSGDNDELIGSHNIYIGANLFLSWQGLPSSAFIMLGEDGKPYYEAQDIMIENNLMLGNAQNEMRAPLAVYASRNVMFRNNTVSGDLPASAFAMLLSRADSNPANENIRFVNNIWSDHTGTMGAMRGQTNNDFSDTRPDRTRTFALYHNVYWNNGQPIPTDDDDKINYTNDAARLVRDPQLRPARSIGMPRWNETTGTFGGGSFSIQQVFVRMVSAFAAIPPTSAAISHADPALAPKVDILGRPRGPRPDAGAFQAQPALTITGKSADGYTEIAWDCDCELPGDATWVVDYIGNIETSTAEMSNLPLDTRTVQIGGLANNEFYSFTVSAVSAEGETLYSNTVHVLSTNLLLYLPIAQGSGR